MLRAPLVVALAACGHTESKPTTGSPWRDDLAMIASVVPEKHPNAFFKLPEAQWRASVAALDKQLPQLDDAHAVVGLVRLVASLGDTHTVVYGGGTIGEYPIVFTWFDDGVFVTGGDASAIGGKLVGIGDRTWDQVLAAITPLVPHDNQAALHARIPPMLGDAGILAGLDLGTTKGATFVLADKAGKTRTLALAPGKQHTYIARPATLPLHLQGPATNYWNKYDAANRLLFFEYKACAEDPKAGPFAKLAAGTLGFVDANPVDRFVIDLRSNQGGDSEIIAPLIDGLAARPALAGKIFVIIGMHTFSSGMLNAIELKLRLKATLVGGPTSGKPHSYGEVLLRELPHSHLQLQYSTKLFTSTEFPGDSVMPDVPVTVTSDDWFAGRDPALDAILAR